MKSFCFENKTKVEFGIDKVKELGSLLKPYCEKVLFVYGKGSIKSTGLYETVLNQLTGVNIEIVEHSGVKSNPVISHVREGVSKAKEFQVDAIVAVGGGSVVDEAKAISVGALSDKDIWTFFAKENVVSDALPIFAVPTVSASASEMNSGTVVTNEEIEKKCALGSPYLFPKISILDPRLTTSLSQEQTALGIIDSVSHILEPYFNAEEHCDLQSNMAEGVLNSLIKTSRKLMNDLENVDLRSDFMWASVIAHNGFLSAGLGRAFFEMHMIAHAIGAIFDVQHGAALAVVMPGWMKFVYKKNVNRFARFAQNVMHVDSSDNSEAAALFGIKAFKDWEFSIGAPVCLRDIGIASDGIDQVVNNISLSTKLKYLESSDDVRQVLNNCVSGY